MPDYINNFRAHSLKTPKIVNSLYKVLKSIEKNIYLTNLNEYKFAPTLLTLFLPQFDAVIAVDGAPRFIVEKCKFNCPLPTTLPSVIHSRKYIYIPLVRRLSSVPEHISLISQKPLLVIANRVWFFSFSLIFSSSSMFFSFWPFVALYLCWMMEKFYKSVIWSAILYILNPYFVKGQNKGIAICMTINSCCRVLFTTETMMANSLYRRHMR